MNVSDVFWSTRIRVPPTVISVPSLVNEWPEQNRSSEIS